MSEIDDLKRKRSRYYTNLSYMDSTHDELSDSISYLKSMQEKQNVCYKVDDVGGGSNYLEYLLETETKIDDNIVNSAIPELERRINNLSSRIAELESQQEEEEE